jgi:hypothetical protein
MAGGTALQAAVLVLTRRFDQPGELGHVHPVIALAVELNCLWGDKQEPGRSASSWLREITALVPTLVPIFVKRLAKPVERLPEVPEGIRFRVIGPEQPVAFDRQVSEQGAHFVGCEARQ